jgi:hypothetical protein
MYLRRSVSAFVLLAILWSILGCGGGDKSAPALSGQVLYVLNGPTVSTYSVDPSSLTATPLEQPVNLLAQGGSLIQADASPNDHHFFLVWSDGQSVQHLYVFATDSSGVPQLPPTQVLNADLLSQFNMHPSGRFAYMLQVSSANNQYTASIRLFHAEGSGLLKEDPTVQASYGPSYDWPVFLDGFSADGGKLYDTSSLTGTSVYREHPIDVHTGALGKELQLLSTSGKTSVVIGRKIIINQYAGSADPQNNYLDILQNAPNPTHPLIHCTYQMLSFCGTATNLRLDHFSQYLFMTDPVTNAIHVAYVNLVAGTITDTGNSIPMTAQVPGFTFSPDGSLVYALLASDNSLHFYQFNANTGSLTEGGTPLPLTAGQGFFAARYQ